MHMMIVKAIADGSGPDITGRIVPMPAGSYHLCREDDRSWFEQRSDVFSFVTQRDDSLAPTALKLDASGNTVLVGPGYFAVGGCVPLTPDYAGCLDAIKRALAGNKVVSFLDVVYDLGSNYLPIVGGLTYQGVPTRLDFNAGGWTGRNREIAGGTRFVSTNQYVFWDGAEDQVAITSTITPQSCTTHIGSPNISVPNSGLFTVGGRVYVTDDACGFYRGVAYFCLSASANVITLGLADKMAIAATSSGAITVAAGTPMDGTSRLVMRDLAGSDCKTFIKMGAKNTFACHYSEIADIFVNGNKAYPAWDICNYNQSNFRNMSAKECDGALFRVDYPVGSFMPGNSTHWRPLLVRSNLTEGNDNYKQRGLIWEANDGSLMNEEHIYFPESFSAYAAERNDATVGLTNGSAAISVANAALWPLDLPVWISTPASPGGFLTGAVYFVVANNGTTIQLSNKKRGTAVVSNATTTVTMRTWGYANLEMVAYGTGNIGSSTLQAADIEANCTMHLLLQRAQVDVLSMGQCPAGETHTCVVGRGYYGQFNSWDPQTSDFDYNSGVQYSGQRTTALTGTSGGIGLWYDADLGGSGVFGVGLNLHTVHQQSTPTMIAAVSGSTYFVKPMQAFGHRMRSQDTSTTLVGTGDYVFAGAAGQTLTLPTFADTNAVNTTLGAPFGVLNCSSNNLTVATGGGQLLNGQAGKTSMTLAPGQWARYFGAKTASGTMIVGVFTNGTI